MAKKPVKPVVKPKTRVKPWDSAIPKDSIGQAVRGVIRGEVAPLEAQEQLGKATLAGNLKWYGDNNTAFQNAMRSLQSSSGVSANEMLRSAANRQVAHDREQNSALEFLRSTMRGDTGGPQRNLHLANDRLNTVRNVENRGLAGQIALNNQAHSGVLSGMRGVGHTSTVEARERARASYTDLMKQLALGKAQAIGKAPAIYRQYAMEQAAAQAALGDQAAKMQLAYDELNTKRDIAEMNAQQRAEAARLAAAGKGAKPGAVGQFARFGIGKEHDKAIAGIYKSLTGSQWNAKEGKFVPLKVSQPWRTTFKRLSHTGITTDQAALLSTLWNPKPKKGSTPGGWLNMLQNRNVSVGIQKQILKRLFGKGAYKKAQHELAVMGLLDRGAGAIGGIKRPPIPSLTNANSGKDGFSWGNVIESAWAGIGR